MAGYCWYGRRLNSEILCDEYLREGIEKGMRILRGIDKATCRLASAGNWAIIFIRQPLGPISREPAMFTPYAIQGQEDGVEG